MHRKQIHCKSFFYICCGGDYRNGIHFFCKLYCCGISASHMAGQQRDHIISRLIHYKHRTVQKLICDKRRYASHCDPTGSNKKQCSFLLHLLSGPFHHPLLHHFYRRGDLLPACKLSFGIQPDQAACHIF